MCTRKQAIQIIVTEKYGNTEKLREQIGAFYDSFVTLGFITELLPIPVEMRSSRTSEKVDWEVTDLAIKKARFFRLETAEYV